MTQTLTSSGGGSLAIAGGRNACLLPAAPAPHGSEPPGTSPDTPFSTVLDDHQARTAIAEGHQQKRQEAARRAAADDGRDHAIETDDDADRDEADKAADATSREASALAALLGGVPLPAGVKLTAVALATTPQAEASARSSAGAPSGAAGLSTAVDALTAPMPTGPSVPAAASALPLRPPVSVAPGAEPAAGAVAGRAAEQSMPTRASSEAAAARATRLADVLQSATARPTGLGAVTTSTSDAAATPPAATVAGAAARSANQAPDQGTTNGSAQPIALALVQPAAVASAQGGTPMAATAPAHGIGLEHAIETVRLALRAAADRGVTHARISLTPRELGAIEVHLRQTADGLVARVVAEHATAAQLLHNAGGELRRQLESQGLTLLRLDIGASGEQGGRAADRQALANGGGAFGDEAGSSRKRDADPLTSLDGTSDHISTTTTLTLPNGALVDVLA